MNGSVQAAFLVENYMLIFKKKLFKNRNFLTAILALYLNQNLLYDQDVSTAVYHINDFVLHLATIFGAILADSWLGLYKTLFIMTMIFCMGCLTLFVAAINFTLSLTRLIKIKLRLTIKVKS